MAIAGPGSGSGSTYTVYDPNIDEYVEVGEEQVTGTGYYSSLVDLSGNGASEEDQEDALNGDNGWIQSAITGGAQVFSSALSLISGGGGNGNGTNGTSGQSGEGNGEDEVFAGMTSQQLMLLAGGGVAIYYFTQNN